MATSFLKTGFEASFGMNSLAGFIPGHENDQIFGRISICLRISKSENLSQNPGIQRSASQKKSLPMQCMGGFAGAILNCRCETATYSVYSINSAAV